MTLFRIAIVAAGAEPRVSIIEISPNYGNSNRKRSSPLGGRPQSQRTILSNQKERRDFI